MLNGSGSTVVYRSFKIRPLRYTRRYNIKYCIFFFVSIALKECHVKYIKISYRACMKWLKIVDEAKAVRRAIISIRINRDAKKRKESTESLNTKLFLSIRLQRKHLHIQPKEL